MSAIRNVTSIIVTAAVACALIVFPPLGQQEAASAAVASDFDPAYIVSDSNFYDVNSMTVKQVQSFLNEKGAQCVRKSGAAFAPCIKDFTETTTTIAANGFCKQYTGAANQSAAQIIVNVAKACGISPRVILVTLHKEQGLILSTGPRWSAYDKATGANCPDTAPCDERFSGFFKQVHRAGNLFQIYKATAANRQYRAGVTTAIQYSPKASCGSRPVTIRNQATAALYIYTPYQPNAAALKNLYGTGDSCSSYGNRNFWRTWTDWFGSPTGNSTTVSESEQTTISTGSNVSVGTQWYFIDGTTAIAWSQARAKNFGFAKATKVSSATLSGYTKRSARLLGVRCGNVRYLVVNGLLRPVQASHVKRYPFGFATLTADTCATLKKGKAKIGKFIKTSNSKVYLIQNGKKRLFVNKSRYRKMLGKHQPARKVTTYFANRIPTGAAIR